MATRCRSCLRRMLAIVIILAAVLSMASCNAVLPDSLDEATFRPYVGNNGNWWIGSVDTEVAASAQDASGGYTPQFTVSFDGHWEVDGERTDTIISNDDMIALRDNPLGLEFYLTSKRTYAVSAGYAKYLTEITIPSTYGGYAVEEIMDFSGCPDLQIVYVPASIKAVNDRAFADCGKLMGLIFDKGCCVTRVGADVLAGTPLEGADVFPVYKAPEEVACSHTDENSDEVCDECDSRLFCSHLDSNTDGKCDKCDRTISACSHEDDNYDGECDKCHEPLSSCSHKDGNDDGRCDNCAKEM